MCIGGKMPPPPKPQPPAPSQRSSDPPLQYVKPEDIKEDEEKDKLKKDTEKAKEIEAAREGTSQLGSVDPGALPDTPSGGTNI